MLNTRFRPQGDADPPLVLRGRRYDWAVSARARGAAAAWAPDVGPAALVTALALGELSSAGRFHGAPVLNAVAIVALGAALLLRRRRPAGSAAVVALIVAVQAVLLGTPESAGLFLGVLLSVFSVSAHARGRVRWLGAAAAAAGNAVAVTLDPNIGSFGEALPATAIVLGAWAIGDLVGRRTDQATKAETARAAAEARREEAAREAVAQERARIAREIHDVIAHGLGAIVVQAGAARLDAGDETAAQRMREIERAARHSLAELRRLLGVLRRFDEALPLAPQPGMDGLDALADTARGAGIDVDVRLDSAAENISPGVELCAYRIVQEGLTNVVKHAGASRCEVLVRRRNGSIEVEIASDGQGSGQADPAGAGFGLIGMRERVQIYGGELETGPRPGGGFLVRARIPLDPGER